MVVDSHPKTVFVKRAIDAAEGIKYKYVGDKLVHPVTARQSRLYHFKLNPK